MPTQYTRQIQQPIEESYFNGRIIVIYGARFYGKTTLLKALQENFSGASLFLDCSDTGTAQKLLNADIAQLRELLGQTRLLLIDDAHKVQNIGLTLKMMGDHFPEMQVVAAGSVRLFDLANDQNIPLAAGKMRFNLYPLSVHALSSLQEQLEERLLFGMIPNVINSIRPQKLLAEMVTPDLYADAFKQLPVRRPQIVFELLQILAMQIGQEFSFNELGEKLDIDKVTAGRYLNLLEDAGLVFTLRPYKRVLKEELSKLRKVYFYDLGVRNQLIGNFNSMRLRYDHEQLWENFFICERLKYNRLRGKFAGSYFWRTYSGAKLMYLEEEQGNFQVFEASWEKKRWHIPAAFKRAYPDSTYQRVERHNFIQYL